MRSRPEPAPSAAPAEPPQLSGWRPGRHPSRAPRRWERAGAAPAEPAPPRSPELERLERLVAEARAVAFELEKGFKSLAANLTEAERDAYYAAHPEWSAAAARYRELVLAADLEHQRCQRKSGFR